MFKKVYCLALMGTYALVVLNINQKNIPGILPEKIDILVTSVTLFSSLQHVVQSCLSRPSGSKKTGV